MLALAACCVTVAGHLVAIQRTLRARPSAWQVWSLYLAFFAALYALMGWSYATVLVEIRTPQQHAALLAWAAPLRILHPGALLLAIIAQGDRQYREELIEVLAHRRAQRDAAP